MADLTKQQVRSMGHAVGLEIGDPELTEVIYSINALPEEPVLLGLLGLPCLFWLTGLSEQVLL